MINTLALALGPWTRRIVELARQSLLMHSIFVVPILLCGIFYEAIHHWWPEIGPADLARSFLFQLNPSDSLRPLMIVVVVMLFLRFYHLVRYVRPEFPTRIYLTDLKGYLFDSRR